jgi:arylsulfatase A-like enzyme/Tfp pilus assembly protein PilF
MKKIGFLLALCAISAIAVILGCQGRGSGPVNVLLISLDTVRPDHLGCYGYDRVSTPNIDEIAQESFVFTDAVASVPLTLPSHSTIFTGLNAVSHGARINGTFVLGEEVTTLAEVLKDHGYATGGFVGSFVIDSRFGTAQGFDTYDDRMETEARRVGSLHPERAGTAVTQSACDWLRDVEEPFLAFVHYYDPHTPYEPPAPYDSIYAGRPYDGEIAFTDGEVGRLIDCVTEKGVSERTLVVLLSDHGEGLGDHDELEHGLLIYDTTIRVALMIDPPSGLSRSRDLAEPGSIDQPVGLVDVFPTVLDLLGIDPGMEIDGRSVVPVMEGKPLPPKMYYIETLYPNLAYKWSPLTGVRFSEWKYILAPEAELYDLEDDPGELQNLHESDPERAAQLKENLLVFAHAGVGAPAEKVKLHGEDAEKLKALGYVSPSGSWTPEDIEPRGTDPKRMIGHLQELLYGGTEAFNAGDMKTAIEKFSRLVELDPMNQMAHLNLAEALLQIGDNSGAEAEFIKLTEIDSTNSQAYLRLGDVARQKGDLDRALFLYRIAADILPEAPHVLSNIGSILMEKGRVDSAFAVLDEALEMDPTDQIALVNMGLGHLHMESYDEALRWFHSTLDVNPEHKKALVNIAHVYIQRGVPDSTIAYLERARDVDRDDGKIFQNLGNAYRQKGMVSQAAEAFERAVELEPENVLALFGLAATRAEEGKSQESITILDKILKIDPDFAPAHQARQHLTSGT